MSLTQTPRFAPPSAVPEVVDGREAVFVARDLRKIYQSGEVEVRAGGEGSSLDRLRRALEVGPTGAEVHAVSDVSDDSSPSLPYPFTIHR